MTCNKISFSSSKDALSFMVVYSARDRPYKCNMCDSWHTTSMTKKESRKSLEILRRARLIKRIRDMNTVGFVLSIQESWMTLVNSGKLYYVEFKGQDRYQPVWLKPMN